MSNQSPVSPIFWCFTVFSSRTKYKAKDKFAVTVNVEDGNGRKVDLLFDIGRLFRHETDIETPMRNNLIIFIPIEVQEVEMLVTYCSSK